MADRRKYTPQENRKIRETADAGAYGGLLGGAAAGYGASRAARKAKPGIAAGKIQYGHSRQKVKIPGTESHVGGHGKLKSTGSALKTGFQVSRKVKPSPAGLGTIGAVYGTATAGTLAGNLAAGRHAKKKIDRKIDRKKEAVGKARTMSDTEIRRRKKIQGRSSQVTGALGLAALGGTMAASRPGRTALRKIPALKNRVAAPKPKDPERDRIKAATVPVLATSAGIGGASAFNFAAYTGAESRKRPVRKNWTPTARNFDSERNRQRRNNIYPGAAAGASGATALAAGVKTARGIKQKKAGDKAKSQKKAYKALHTGANKNFRAAGKLGAAGAGLAAGSMALERKRKSESWGVYKSLGTTGEIGKTENYLEEISKLFDVDED